jgi:hypothetical protein
MYQSKGEKVNSYREKQANKERVNLEACDTIQVRGKLSTDLNEGKVITTKREKPARVQKSQPKYKRVNSRIKSASGRS